MRTVTASAGDKVCVAQGLYGPGQFVLSDGLSPALEETFRLMSYDYEVDFLDVRLMALHWLDDHGAVQQRLCGAAGGLKLELLFEDGLEVKDVVEIIY